MIAIELDINIWKKGAAKLSKQDFPHAKAKIPKSNESYPNKLERAHLAGVAFVLPQTPWFAVINLADRRIPNVSASHRGRRPGRIFTERRKRKRSLL